MIGIYKITSPSGRIYIGQSNNIKKRFNKYTYLKCAKQPRLYNSLLKYGVENHIFEILEECEFEELNIKERYYQDFYDVLNDDKGLNCRLTETDILPSIISEATREKMRNNGLGKQRNLGNKHSEESRIKMSNSHKGKKLSNELKEKLLNANLGRKMPENVKMALDWTGKKHLEESKLKMSLSKKGKSHSIERRLNKCKIILDLYTGIYYYGVFELSKILNINSSTLYNGINKKITKYDRYIIT